MSSADGHVGGRLGAFDARADRLLEPLRRSPVTARVFRFASEVGDFSLVWHVIGLVYGLGIRRELDEVVVFALAMAAESLVLNQGIKRLFRRRRPTVAGDPRTPVRVPRTSSFPSGHASSAAFACSLLVVWTSAPWAPLWIAIALVVALSRAVVRIHFASDVLAGVVTGSVLAQIALLSGAVDALRH
ncbi:MAG: phosphatase PAP2 family protein [Actinobacteria bacterium]|nr:phosphatase PAP2 family protein [Actinomycetota bacterium]